MSTKKGKDKELHLVLYFGFVCFSLRNDMVGRSFGGRFSILWQDNILAIPWFARHRQSDYTILVFHSVILPIERKNCLPTVFCFFCNSLLVLLGHCQFIIRRTT
jgi:hypothetical protein